MYNVFNFLTIVILRFPLHRPIPDREFVETYVKAFYLTENEMERWIREHKVIFLTCYRDHVGYCSECFVDIL